MPQDSRIDEGAWRQFPLPLAQLCRRAANAKTDVDGHLTAFSLAEVAIKLISSTAIVHYAEQPAHDERLVESLRKLARPSLGHWWEFARTLTPVLAERMPAYERLREVLFEKVHDDCPRAAGLNAALLQALGRSKSPGLSVRFRDLFDHVIEYRNKVLFHAAPGQLPPDLHRQMSGAFLLGMNEVLAKVDVLAGSQLTYVSEVKQSQGKWQVTRFELTGENPRRQPAWELPREAVDRLPDAERVYLLGSDQRFRSLYPLALYDPEHEEFLLLNSRRGTQRTDYLCYTSGRTEEMAGLFTEQRKLLADILQIEVSDEEVVAWAAASRAEETLADPDDGGEPTHKTLGEFELISELGRGGMGVVYRARQPSLRREVALKKLLRTGGGSEQRFLREIRALGRVEHPHLVKILTSGSVGEDWYYAMELVDGVPMSAVCSKLKQSGSVIEDLDLSTWEHALTTACTEVRNREKPVGDSTASGTKRVRAAAAAEIPQRLKAGRGYVERVVDLIRQAASAVNALHDEGITHRDVKPGNIMVTADGQRALLMDLGLAQLADEEEGRLTRTRQFVGTLRYASPEQVLAAEKVDRRSDIYGLGATLWELLTLRPLFDADEQVPEAEVMRRIQLDEPESVRKHNNRVDKDLDAIIGKCLEKRPDRRYATARELSEDLRRWQRRDPVLARRVTKLEKGARWFARRPALATACVLAFLTIVLGTGSGLALWGYWKADEARDELATANVALKSSNASLEDARQASDEQAEKAREAERKAREAETQATQAAREASDARDELAASNSQLIEAQRLLQRGSYADQVLFAQNLWQMGNPLRARERLIECQPELRGWEWDHLRTAFSQHERAASPPQGKNLYGAMSGDGRTVAMASTEGEILLWDASEIVTDADGGQVAGELRSRLAEAGRKVRGLFISRDGRRVAAVDEGAGIRVWDGESGKLLGEGTTGTTALISFCTFSPDGSLLAAACDDNRVRTWKTDNGLQPLEVFAEHADTVNTVVFTPDGERVASGGYDGQLLIWDPRTADVLQQFTTALNPLDAYSAYSTNTINQIAFTRDGSLMASCGSSGEVRLWDVPTAQHLATLQRDLNEELSYAFHFLSYLMFSPDGRYLAAAESQEILVWTVPTPEQLANPNPFSDSLFPRFPVTAVLQGHTDWVFGMAFSPDSIYLASSGSDQSIRLWTISTGAQVVALYGHESDPGPLAFSEDGGELVSVDASGSVRWWDLAFSATHSAAETVLAAHTDRVSDVEYGPDGRKLATASYDGTVKLWDAETGRQRRSINARGQVDPDDYSYEWTQDVAFDPEGELIAAGTDAGRVQLWRAESGEPVATLQQPAPKSGDLSYKGLMRTVAFSQPGMKVAIAGESAEVHLWDAKTNSLTARLVEHTGELTYLAFGPRGDRLASAGSDGNICLWSMELLALERTLEGHAGAVNCIAFNGDGKLLASGGQDRTVRVWDAATGELKWSHDEHGTAIDVVGPIHVAFDPGGKKLASAGDDGAILIWDVANGTVEHRLEGHTDVVRYVAFSPKGDRIASASEDYTARIWDVASGQLLHELEDPQGVGRYGHKDWVNMVLWHPDGIWVATCSDDGTVQIWKAATGEHLQTFGEHADWVRAIALTPDGTRLASACDDHKVRIWDTSNVMADLAPDAPDSPDAPAAPGTEEFEMSSAGPPSDAWSVFSGHSSTVRYVEFIGEGTNVISGVTSYSRSAKMWTADSGTEVASYDIAVSGTESGSGTMGRVAFNATGDWLAGTGLDRRSVQIWTVPAGDRHAEFEHPRAVQTFAWSPAGALMATGCLDGVVRLWDADTGELLQELEGHSLLTESFSVDGGVRHVAFSPRGDLLASAGGDRTVRIWDVGGRRLTRTLTGHQSEVERVAFSPDGKVLASASTDETARLWSIADGGLIHTLNGHDKALEAVLFSPDGARLLTTSSDGSIRLWDVETGRAVAIFQILNAAEGTAPRAQFDPEGGCIAATGDEYHVNVLKTSESESQRAERRRQWRRSSADSAAAGRNWAGALFHLRHLVPEMPDDVAINYQYANVLAEMERWDEAREAFVHTLSIAAANSTDRSTILLRLGLLQLAGGDVSGYRSSCEELYQAAADARAAAVNPDIEIYDNEIYAAWLAGVSPQKPPDWEKFRQLALDPLTNGSGDELFYRETYGILLFRAGYYQDAVEEIAYVDRRSGSTTNPEAQFVMAMALQKLGRHKEALGWYVDALQLVGAWEEALAVSEEDPFGLTTTAAAAPTPVWEVRLRRSMLRAEADAVFKDEIAPAAPP